MSSYDTIILGSSPNALTAACYLARAGKKVLVLEPSDTVGGEASTVEFAKGFKGDVALTSGRIDAEIAKDLKLTEHGLEVIERNTLTSLLPGGKSLTLLADRDAAAKAIGSFSARDAAKYKQFMELVDLASGFLKSAYDKNPPRQHPPAKEDLEQLTSLVGELKGYGRREMTEVMRLIVMSVRDLLNEWFESSELKGLLAACAVRGINQGPFAAGTSFSMLHDIAQGDGFFRATARGGIGAISQAIAKAAQSFGAEVRTGAGALSVIVTDGKATGVKAGGEELNANSVISDFDARYTFTKFVPPPELEPEFNRALRNLRYAGSVARINLALMSMPKFKGLTDDALKGTLTVSPSLEYLERAHDDGKRGRVSTNPFMEISLPSVSDDTLAPAGKHVMSIWMQHVPLACDANEASLAELAIKQLSEFCPELKSLVEHTQVITPRQFESRYHLSEGQLYGGEINLAQAFYLRPIPGFSQNETPISQLFLCGSATHPGGISGQSGRNAARALGVKEMVPA
jgi:phytoene dehydrogenase-like protein